MDNFLSNNVDSTNIGYVILSHFSYLWSAIPHFFFYSKPSHGPKSYKSDQVAFCGLSLTHSISGLGAQIKWDKNHGIE